jgi:hypothetical protein
VAKKRPRPRAEHWQPDPEEHDYPAAADYLSLLFAEERCGPIVAALRAAPTVHRKAKDLLRASSLPLLPADDPAVVRDLAKVAAGTLLSPVLLVRPAEGAPLVVADGYHRICASYHLDEDADIPCRLVGAS